MRPNLSDGSWKSGREENSRHGKLVTELKTYDEPTKAGKKPSKKPFGATVCYHSDWRGNDFSFTHWYPTIKARDNALRSHGGTLRCFKVVHVELVER